MKREGLTEKMGPPNLASHLSHTSLSVRSQNQQRRTTVRIDLKVLMQYRTMPLPWMDCQILHFTYLATISRTLQGLAQEGK